jgi:hypothetical protein
MRPFRGLLSAVALAQLASGRPLRAGAGTVVHSSGTFNPGRNAEKRRDRRRAVIERCARRFRESWARETRNPAQRRPYGWPKEFA